MFSTLFETEDIVAVDKPGGLSAITERDPNQDNLLAQLAAQHSEKIYVVHRLDKAVSGVMIFAKNARMHRYLNTQFGQRAVAKTYTAVSHGVIKQEHGSIDQPLRQFGSGRVAVDPQRGKPSVTEYCVTERLAGYTMLDVMPLSGRRHQIRAHFFSIGYPLVGDLQYGDKAQQARYARLMLHASRIAFRLPDGTDVVITAPLPTTFRNILDGLRESAKSML